MGTHGAAEATMHGAKMTGKSASVSHISVRKPSAQRTTAAKGGLGKSNGKSAPLPLGPTPKKPLKKRVTAVAAGVTAKKYAKKLKAKQKKRKKRKQSSSKKSD